MPRNRSFPVLTLLMLLVACGSAPATTISTVAPASTAASVPTAASAASPTRVVLQDTNPQKPNDATQGRLRLAHFIFGGPHVDLLVNGEPAVNGGVAQINMPAGYVNGYLYLEPGTYSVAVVPTGQGVDQALIGPLDVPLVAGHRYTLALMGQLEDTSITPLVIDETEAEQAIGAKPSDNVRITVNNLFGVAKMNAGWDEQLINEGIPYGSFGAGIYPVANGAITVTMSNAEALLYDPADWNGPGSTFMYAFVGTYPGAVETDWVIFNGTPTSELNLIDYLQGFSDLGLRTHGTPTSFKTFLSIVEAAGLTEELANGGPYLVLAPIDLAFTIIPKDELDALLANPKAAGDLVRNHIIEDYVPRGSLGKTPGAPFDRSFTNMLGQTISIGEGYTINRVPVGDFESYFVANGTQVHPITKVLLPETK